MRFTLWPERVSGAGGRFGSWIGSAAAFFLVIVVAANIIARILGHSIPGILDISQNFMVIIVVMMLAYTQAQRGHIGVEFVLNLLPESGKRVVGLITLLLSLAFAVLLAEKLPQLLETSISAVEGVDIDRVVVLDGGSGEGVSNAVNQRVHGALGTMEAISAAVGVDITDVLQGAAKKMGSGEGK